MLQGRKKGGGQDHRHGLVNFNRRSVVNLVGVSIPNPISEYFEIDGIEPHDEISGIEIFNLIGVRVKEFSHNECGRNNHFNIGDLPNGSYTITAKLNNCKFVSQKIIVLH